MLQKKKILQHASQWSAPVKTELCWPFTTSRSSNQREITPWRRLHGYSYCMRHSHWMRGPSILSNGWLSSTEILLNLSNDICLTSPKNYFNLKWLKINFCCILFIFVLFKVEFILIAQIVEARDTAYMYITFKTTLPVSDLIFSLYIFDLTFVIRLFIQLLLDFHDWNSCKILKE